MTRTPILLPALASALLLAGCSAGTSTSPSTAATDTGDGGTAPTTVSTPAAASGPDGCGLVTEQMIRTALGTDPGSCAPEASNTSGPASGRYATIHADVQISTQASLYMPAASCSQSAVSGSLAIPGTDRGYASTGGFCLVKGETGVMVTGFVQGATADQVLALAQSTLAAL